MTKVFKSACQPNQSCPRDLDWTMTSRDRRCPSLAILGLEFWAPPGHRDRACWGGRAATGWRPVRQDSSEEVSSLRSDSKLCLKNRNGGLLPKFPSFGKSWHLWENMLLVGAQSPPNSLLRQYLRPTQWPFFSDLHRSSSTSSLCRPFPISRVH